MKELKFRAWDKIRKWMVEVAALHIDFKRVVMFDKNNSSYFEGIDDVILLQFTGLLDKNKKEIFEGDIVKIFGDDTPFEVIFNQALARFQFGSYAMRELSPFNNSEKDDLLLRNVEVIGNIYENPELLEVKKC